MANKMKYVYQFSLANGKIVIHESEGLYSIGQEGKEDERILINSAALVNVFEVDEDGNPVKGQIKE